MIRSRIVVLVVIVLLASAAYKVARCDAKDAHSLAAVRFVLDSRELIPEDGSIFFDWKGKSYGSLATKLANLYCIAGDTDYGHPLFFYAWRISCNHGGKSESTPIYLLKSINTFQAIYVNSSEISKSIYLFNLSGEEYDVLLVNGNEDIKPKLELLKKSGIFSLHKITVKDKGKN
jgi:hypothetical protein